MAEKLNAGDTFPKLDFHLTDGRMLTVPDNMDSRYRIVLFYRGHW